MDPNTDPIRLEEWQEVIGKLKAVSTAENTRYLQIDENYILLDGSLDRDLEELVGCEVALLQTNDGLVLEVKK